MLTATKYLKYIKYYFDKNDWAMALAIIMGESGGVPDAENLEKSENHTWWLKRWSAMRKGAPPTKEYLWGSYGLFQIGSYNADSFRKVEGQLITKIDQLKNPGINIAIASKLAYNFFGWKNWGAFTNGSYKKFLNQAITEVAANKHIQPAKASTEVDKKQLAKKTTVTKPTFSQKPPERPQSTQTKPMNASSDKSISSITSNREQNNFLDVEKSTKNIGNYVIKNLKRDERISKFIDRGQRVAKFFGGSLGLHMILDRFVASAESRWTFLQNYHDILVELSWLVEFVFLGLAAWFIEWLIFKYVQKNPNASPILKRIVSIFASQKRVNDKLKRDEIIKQIKEE